MDSFSATFRWFSWFKIVAVVLAPLLNYISYNKGHIEVDMGLYYSPSV